MGGEVGIALDATTGALLIEETASLPRALHETLHRLVGPAQAIACAAPVEVRMLAPASPRELATVPCVRLAGYWHDSLIEGPGRRSTAKLQGCPIRCRGCVTPESWDAAGGHLVPVGRLADALLDPARERDGVTVLGGEPFAQPERLLALVRALRDRGCPHLVCYSGYTYERLRRVALQRPTIGAVLDEIDVLIDGPYVAALADRAGPWTGSGNQRVIAAIRSAEKTLALLGDQDVPIVWDGRLGQNVPRD